MLQEEVERARRDKDPVAFLTLAKRLGAWIPDDDISPEVIVTAMAGRYLRDVIRHPGQDKTYTVFVGGKSFFNLFLRYSRGTDGASIWRIVPSAIWCTSTPSGRWSNWDFARTPLQGIQPPSVDKALHILGAKSRLALTPDHVFYSEDPERDSSLSEDGTSAEVTLFSRLDPTKPYPQITKRVARIIKDSTWGYRIVLGAILEVEYPTKESSQGG